MTLAVAGIQAAAAQVTEDVMADWVMPLQHQYPGLERRQVDVAFDGSIILFDLKVDGVGNLSVLPLSQDHLAAPNPSRGVLVKIDGQTGQRSDIAGAGLLLFRGLVIHVGPDGQVSCACNMMVVPTGRIGRAHLSRAGARHLGSSVGRNRNIAPRGALPTRPRRAFSQLRTASPNG